MDMKDSWQSGDPYEYYMGRWSKLVAEKFVDWLSPQQALNWLDLGCGSGALSEAIINGAKPASVVAIDQSEGFVQTTQKRLGARVRCKVGDAMSLPLDDGTLNMAVSGLVLNFIPAPEKALAEMRRVTTQQGTVAVYVWDYAGKMEFLNTFWDAATKLNPGAADLHERRRFGDTNAEQLRKSFTQAGFSDIETTSLEIVTRFVDFDDYWQPFLGKQGPAPTYVSKLSSADRDKLKDTLVKSLPPTADGSIVMTARAWAAKGKV